MTLTIIKKGWLQRIILRNISLTRIMSCVFDEVFLMPSHEKIKTKSLSCSSCMREYHLFLCWFNHQFFLTSLVRHKKTPYLFRFQFSKSAINISIWVTHYIAVRVALTGSKLQRKQSSLLKNVTALYRYNSSSGNRM